MALNAFHIYFTADTLGRSPLPEYELAVRCLGAVVFYLRYCLTDTEILSLGLIHEYRPVDVVSESTAIGRSEEPFYERQVNMVSCGHWQIFSLQRIV